MNMEVACVAALSDCMPTMHSTHKKWANMNYRAIQEKSIRIADDCIVQQAPTHQEPKTKELSNWTHKSTAGTIKYEQKGSEAMEDEEGGRETLPKMTKWTQRNGLDRSLLMTTHNVKKE